jgi:hypothetical protein
MLSLQQGLAPGAAGFRQDFVLLRLKRQNTYMPIYEMTLERINPVATATFASARIHERYDLQRLIRDQIEIVSPGCMVVAEEFGSWDESNRRIDLLAVDRDGTLVVVELKRSEDGGHMELQAIRYAAMVSSMTFEQAVNAHDRYLQSRGRLEDARELLTEFLEEGASERFADQVRIVLVSAQFTKELTTSVIWLSQQGLDVRCVRLRPYLLDDRLLLDIQQVIPLPEALDYQVRIREKQAQERIARQDGRDYTKYDVTVDSEVFLRQNKRNAARISFLALCRKGAAPERIMEILGRNEVFVWADGSLGKEEFLKAVEGRFKAERIRRCWTEADDLLLQDGKTYAITKMWGGDIAEAVARVARTLAIGGVTCSKSPEGE